VAGRLVQTDRGYIAALQRGDVAQLTSYDDSLHARGSVWLRGVEVQDLAVVRDDDTRGLRLLLLLTAGGRTALYVSPLDSGLVAGRFEMRPLSSDSLPGARRIVGSLPTAGDGEQRASRVFVVAGDSMIAATDDSGRTLYLLTSSALGRRVLGSFLPRTDRDHIILVTHGPDGVRAARLDAYRGTVNADLPLGMHGASVLGIVESSRHGEVLAIATPSPAPVALLVELSLRSSPERTPLRASPLGVTSVAREGQLMPAVVVGRIPGPGVQVLGQQRVDDLEYPLSSQPEEMLSDGQLRLLVTGDSIAMYDQTFTFRGSAESIGGTGRSLRSIDTVQGIVVHDEGSRIIVLGAGSGWLERNGGRVIVAGMLVMAVTLLTVGVRRYRFLATIYNNMVRVPGAQGVIVVSTRGRVQHLNDSARSTLGIDAYIPLGRHLLEYLRGDGFAHLATEARTMLETGEPFSDTIVVDDAVGSRSLTVQGRPLTAAAGSTAGYLLLVDDVTGTLERERLLGWASVAHHIAHEMKTPLGTVTMTTELLHDRLERESLDPEFRKATARIMRQASRLRGIVDDLLTIARTESLERTPTDLGLLIETVAGDIQEHVPPNVAMTVRSESEDLWCMVDVHQMVAALRNIIDNAWQAVGDRPDGEVSITSRGDESSVVVTIADNGRGMTPQTLGKLFQPFYTERAGGSGIGTVIVKRVIEAHGGTIRVDSEAGVGSTFTITLPRG